MSLRAQCFSSSKHFSLEEENDSSTSSTGSASATEPLTAYCENGCQGACACPALNPQMSEPNLSPQLSLSGPDVPPPQPFPEVIANGSQSSLRKRSRPSIQHLKDKLHGNRGGSELDGSEKRGSQVNGSGRKGSDLLKGERRTSRLTEWYKKNFKGGLKRRSSEQVSQGSSHQKTESPKSHRGKNREDS